MPKRKTAKKLKRPLVIHHSHSGKLVHRKHTSYALLAFILMIVGVLLASLTLSVRAANLNVTAAIMGDPPPYGATITEPTNNQHFSVIPIDVKGTCPADAMVKIFRNDVFSGAVLCDNNNTFGLKIDLFEGQNILEARVFSSTGLEGPNTPKVTVFYNPPHPITSTQNATPSSHPITQLFLKSDNLYKGYLIGEQITWPIEIVGGSPPYALNVEWGDGSSDLISRSQSGLLNLSHTYKQADASYNIIVKASDNSGQKAYLQLVTIITDPKLLASTKKDTTGLEASQDLLHKLLNRLLISWPFYLLASFMLVSFWFGERWQLHLLQRRKPTTLAKH